MCTRILLCGQLICIMSLHGLKKILMQAAVDEKQVIHCIGLKINGFSLYTYRAKTTEPTEQKIELKEGKGLKRPQGVPPPVLDQLRLEYGH